MIDLKENEGEAIDKFILESAHITPAISALNLSCAIYCPDPQMYRIRLQFLFEIKNLLKRHKCNSDDESISIFTDMVHTCLVFSSETHFTYTKSIVFLSIFFTIINQALSSSFYNPSALFADFEKLLLDHSVDRPPFQTDIFDLEDVKKIHQFFLINLFRNLKLILNAFTSKPRLVFHSIFPSEVVLPVIPPLSEFEVVGNKAPSALSIQSLSEPTSAKDEPPVEAIERVVVEPEEEDLGPEVPHTILLESLNSLHNKFVSDFEEKERLIFSKIKELEIKSIDKAPKKVPSKISKK